MRFDLTQRFGARKAAVVAELLRGQELVPTDALGELLLDQRGAVIWTEVAARRGGAVTTGTLFHPSSLDLLLAPHV